VAVPDVGEDLVPPLLATGHRTIEPHVVPERSEVIDQFLDLGATFAGVADEDFSHASLVRRSF
jgi:hypothetical protein